MRHEVLGAGLNVVIDSVLSNADKAVGLGEQLAAAGYSIEVLDVEVPYELSAARISSRWRLAYENALATGEGLGGRWVPSTYARDVFDPATVRAFSQESALRLASECEAVLPTAGSGPPLKMCRALSRRTWCEPSEARSCSPPARSPRRPRAPGRPAVRPFRS